MADYSLRDMWWLQPKGPDNPLPALQLGVQMSQYKSSMLLKEKELANDIARTEIAQKESEAKIKLQTSISEGNAEMAAAAAKITDFSDPAQMKAIYDLGARYGTLVGTKGWEGLINTHERAVRAKQLGANTQSMIDRRTAQTEMAELDLERKNLLADATIDLKDERLLDNSARRSIATSRLALDQKKFELQRMLGDSRMDVNDATIAEKQQDIDQSERRLLIQEGNLALRKEELGQKGRRLDAREQAGYNNELKALNSEEAAKLKVESSKEKPDQLEIDRLRKFYNLKRRALTGKFYGDETAPRVPRAGLRTNDPPVVAPQPIAPENNPRAAEIRASLREGKITRDQALEQLRELGFK